jgi:superfamily I DNA/RNA helicase
VQEVLASGVPTFVRLSHTDLGKMQLIRLAQVYDLYVQRMQELQLFDFDDLLSWCLTLIKHNPDVSYC